MKAGSVVWMFCRVIDNLGDAGVCWRLARQLSGERGLSVSLFIDSIETLLQFAPGLRVDSADALQAGAGGALRVIHWTEGDSARMLATAHEAPQLVLSTFGCELPALVRDRIGRRDADQPVWINLEYLSAEEWVSSFHGRPSPKPTDGAVEHFFFPGFTPATGGLLREAGLDADRNAFQSSSARDSWLAAHGLTATDQPGKPVFRISLFCYQTLELGDWIQALAGQPDRTLLLATTPIATRAFTAAGAPPDASTWQTGSLEVRRVPMLSQDDYDRLLWSCDLNIVRGEDSWIRAHWAARPFIWQPYPQSDETHLHKLDAFLSRIADTLCTDTDVAIDAMRRMMHAWSTGQDLIEAWRAYRQAWSAIVAVHERWRGDLRNQTDLAHRLLAFAGDRLK